MVKAYDSDPFRTRLNQLSQQFQKLYDERMPVLRDYEDFAKTQLDTLIGQTVPQAQQIFRDAADYTTETSSFLRQAQQYDTPERRQAEAGKAMADVTSAGEQARENSIAQLESFGIDPSQTRSASLDQNLRVQSALEAVRAGKAAQDTVENKGREYTAQALGIKGEAVGREATAAATGANILGNNVQAAGQQVNTGVAVTGVGNQLLGQKQGIIESTARMKEAEQASKMAAKGSKTAGIAAIGQTLGMAGGAALGAFGGPMGMMMGAQLGGAFGGGLAGGGGGMGAMGSMSGMPTSWGASPAVSAIPAGAIGGDYAGIGIGGRH
jgi:hypothetical protein